MLDGAAQAQGELNLPLQILSARETFEIRKPIQARSNIGGVLAGYNVFLDGTHHVSSATSKFLDGNHIGITVIQWCWRQWLCLSTRSCQRMEERVRS